MLGFLSQETGQSLNLERILESTKRQISLGNSAIDNAATPKQTRTVTRYRDNFATKTTVDACRVENGSRGERSVVVSMLLQLLLCTLDVVVVVDPIIEKWEQHL
jgi:hypothetical protein